MNITYTKVLLYAYSNIDDVIEQIDELVEKKGVVSMWDNSPAMEQYLKIIELKEQKGILIELKRRMEIVLKKFTTEEMKYFEYRYFRKRAKDYYEGFDVSSRAYFRKHDILIRRLSLWLDYVDLTDSYFNERLKEIDFFKDLTRIVKENERSYSKKNIDEQTGNYDSKENLILLNNMKNSRTDKKVKTIREGKEKHFA